MSSSSGTSSSTAVEVPKDYIDVYISTKDIDEGGAIEEATKLKEILMQQGLTVCVIENRKMESNKRLAFDQILLAKLVVIMVSDGYGARNSDSRAELKFIVEARKPSLLIKMTDVLSFNSMENVKVVDWPRGANVTAMSVEVSTMILEKLQSISLNMGTYLII